MRTLFLTPPSLEGFDGVAGARYQARREIRSFWYPTWLAQVAAMVPDSRLIDAPARGRFTADCHKLGISIHGTFVLGLPGETPETIERTIRFAREINPHTIQVSLPAVYPGTELYRQAVESGWLADDGQRLVGDDGIQVSSLSYPHLPREKISRAVETFYRRFYFRPGKIMEFISEMACSPQMMKRRLREGGEFFRFLSSRERKA